MTDIIGIFDEAFEYTKANMEKILIFGIICLIADLSGILKGFGMTGVIINIFSVISVVVSFIVTGYLLNIVKTTSESSHILPEFDWINDITNGIKNDILMIIYFIIPFILLTIVAIATTNTNTVNKLLSFITSNPNTAVPTNLITPLMGSISSMLILGFILFIIFGLMAFIGQCRLAKSGSLKDGLDFGAVLRDINNIGLGSIIVWIIMLAVILVILGIIGSIILYIPYIGSILNSLFITSFTGVFISAATGYLYGQI